MNTQNPSRRRFLVHAAVAAVAIPFAGRFISTAQAQSLPKLPLDDPQAKALSYAEDYTKVSHPSFKPGSNCANCQFFTAATGVCTLFPKNTVPANAWCSAWAKRA